MSRPCSLAAAVVGGLACAAVQAMPIIYHTSLSGTAEDPPNASPGTGSATVVLDLVAHTMAIDISFSDLLGTTTAAHIHCCTAVAGAGNVGVATQTPSFVGFPLGVSAGTYDSGVFDLTLASSWNPAFVTANGGTLAGAEAALGVGMAAGKAYVNIHSTFRAPGEIRGFLQVPEPASLALMALSLAALAVTSRKRFA